MFPRIAPFAGVFFCVLVLFSSSLEAQCQPNEDCNQNGVADQCDIDLGSSDDCNGNLIPDECDLELLTSEDCNLDGIPDECSPSISELVGIGLSFGDGFGSSVDSSPQYAVVGAPDDDLLGTNTGSANIFKRTGTQWIEEMKIFGISASLEDHFGAAVAVEGDLVAIGAPGKMQGRGAVFLYRRVGNGWWNYEGTLTAFDAPLGAAFGSALAIENEMIVVGAPGTVNGLGSGAVYLFSRESGMWLQEQKLESDTLTDGDMLGSALAIHEGTIVAGAPGYDAGGMTNSGLVIIFEESAGTWTESLSISANNPSPFASFGFSIDVDQDRLLVGAPGENVETGAAYLHTRLANMWINQVKMEPLVPEEGGLFGADVGLDVKTLVISAPAAGSDQGQVVIYRQQGADWIREEPMTQIVDRQPGEQFGSSLSCQLPFLIVGSSGQNSGDSLWISVYNDCNSNLEDDICDVTQGLEPDCNFNLVPDSCEISDGTKQDCDGNGIPDECQISTGELPDCNMNGIPDACDISSGFSLDCNLDGNPDECQTGADPNPPSISNMPGPFSVSTDQGICGAVLTWDEPVATDDCGVDSLESSHASGSLFSTGLTVVTYTATDVSGNVRTAMFTVVVTDNELPTLSDFQAEVIAEAGQGVCELSVSWPNPTPQDNCAVFSSSVSHQPGTLFPIGTTEVVYTLMDSNGNMSTLNMNVIVLDTSAPEIVDLPADIQSGTDLGSCNKIVEWIDPTSTDDCTVESFTSTHQSGDTFDLGTTVVTYTVVDAGGNSVHQSFNVTITDQELPTFTAAPASISTGNDPGDCGAVITWAPAVVNDNCGIASMTSSHQPGDHFDLGDTEVSITTTDVNGNVSTHLFTITILDTEAPVLSNIPQNIVLNNDPAECTAVYNWGLPQISDNCGISTFEGSSNSGESFPLGTTTVEYLLVDTSGNQSTGSFDITVNDTEMPILLGMPQDIAVFNDPGQCGANVSWIVPTPWDNCNLVDFDGSHEPGAFFPKGVTEVSYLVMDGMGQVTSGTFAISVDDDEAPTITGMPADRTIVADAGLCSAIHEWVLPIGQDNCEVVSFTASHDPGDTFPVGVTEIGYSVTDSMGMTTTDQFSLTVLDQEDPVIIRIPGDISVVADEGECSMPVSWIAPDSQDNCAIDTFSISHVSGSVFETGVTTVSIDTQDIHGNTAAASFQVTVLDQETPQILSLPAAIQLESDTDQCGTLVTWVEPLGSDNCQVALLSTASENGGFYPVGSSTVTYMIEDASGNSDEASFNITITDTTNPQFMQIPNGISVSSDQGDCGAIVTWLEVTASDNCDIASITGTHSSGDFFNKGLTVVEHTATDIHGNQITQSFNINVDDNELPVISGIDQNLVIENDLGQCGANVTWQEPTASDNCEITSLTVNIPSGAFFSEGTTVVTYSTSDDSGNETTKSFNVTVQDLELPSFTSIPVSVVAETTTNSCSGIATWDTVMGTDNCLVSSIVSSHESGDNFPLGNTQVSVSITDIHGNTREQEFSVLIEDTELPSFVDMPEDIFQTTEAGLCGAVIDWTEPSAADNCLVNELSGTHSPNTFFDRGITVVTYTVTDASGNEYQESFQINIVDLEVPQLTAPPADIQAIADTGSCGTNISWIEPTATDNCSVQSVISSHDPEDFFLTGTTIVSYTAQDPTGNISTVQFLVTILDEEMPTIENMPISVVVDNDQGDCGAIVSWDEPTILDNCGIAASGPDHQSGSFFAVGSTLVTYVAEDVSGNQINAAFTVTVEDNQAPQFQGSISNAILDTDAGECGAVHSWVAPEVSENCAGLQVTTTHEPGSFFTPGLNIVTYTASDAAGNATSLMFTVVVQDNEDPVITGTPASMDLGTDLDSCGRVVSWQQPVASDNCALLSYSSTHNSGEFFPVGATTVIFTATDTVGHSTSTQFEIVVSDNQAPSITQMPQDVVINSQLGICGSGHAWDLPLSSDNCPDHVFSGSHLPGDEFPVGTSTVSYTAIDAAGNVTSEAFSITVVDIENPMISDLPENMSVGTDPDQCNAIVEWAEPTFTDNCQVSNFSVDIPSGSIFDLGTTTVTYMITDSAGLQMTASFDVTVEDTQVPILENMPSNVVLTNEPGSCEKIYTWNEPIAVDNCPNVEMTSSHQSGDSFPVGLTIVEYQASDANGLSRQVFFTVVVMDMEEPVISGIPESVIIENDQDACGAIHSWIDPAASDNCATIGFSTNHANGSFFDVGTTTVTYTVSDPSGNTVSSSFDVTVVDLQVPAFVTMPANVSINTDPGVCGATHTWDTPQINDNCDSINLASSHQSGDIFPIGDTVVNYTAQDLTGNVISDSFTVTVTDFEDPDFEGIPATIVASTDSGQCDAVISWVPPVPVDNCEVASHSMSHQPGDTFALGETTVLLSAFDIYGNEFNTSFKVVVEDLELPVISGTPESVTLQNIPGFCGSTHDWVSPTATDNCDTLAVISSHVSGSMFPTGTTTVDFEVIDLSGNSSVSSFEIIVEDIEAPEFTTIPTDFTASADVDQCGTAVTWAEATGTDNCEVSSIEYDRANGEFLGLGEYPVNATITDIHGNSATQQFVITVVDDTPPGITNMPADILLIADSGQCGSVATWSEPASTDNCSGELLANNIISGSFFIVGDTQVSYVATDVSGNTTTEIFTVTVVDNQAPTLENIPADFTVSNDPGTCGAHVSWIVESALDNCGIQSHVSSKNPGDLFPHGTTTVQINATDNSGNSVSGSFQITVEDTEAPEIVNLPNDLVVNSDQGLCGAIVSWVEPFAVDNCEMGTLTSSVHSGTYLTTGVHSVTYSASDVYGNVREETFSIEVLDSEAPVISSGPGSVELTTEPGQCGASFSWSELQVTDNCSVVEITRSHENGAFFQKGTTLVTLTATDAAGGSIQHEFEVSVSDNESPQFGSTLGGVSLTTTPGECGSLAFWEEPEFSDNCEISTVVKSHEPGDFFQLGETLVTYTLTDGSGNSSSIDFMVQILDTELPVISGLQSGISVVNDIGSCGAAVFWDSPVVTDNCSIVSIESTHQSGDYFPVGSTVVTYGVADSSDLTSSFEFAVVVEDAEAPVLLGVPSQQTLQTEQGMCGATVSWSSPMASDNCQIASLTSDVENGTFLNTGNHTINFEAIDIHGNVSQASFGVIILDEEAPQILDVPTTVEGVNDAGSCQGSVTWIEPTISDNCSDYVVVTSHQSGASFPIGTTTVTYTVDDLSGNQTSVAFEVIISDIHGPEIAGLPLGISTDTDPGLCIAVVTWPEAVIADLCDTHVVSQSHLSGAEYPVGLTMVSYVATDAVGNVTEVTFPITVTDNEAPQITFIPENQVLIANEDECSMIANWAVPTAVDNCGIASITTSALSGDQYSIGVNTVEVLVIDVNGNESNAAFQITVVDTESPIITGTPADISVVSDPTICGAEITWVEPSVIENCELLAFESDHVPGEVFPVGLTIVTYVATDASGNSVSASFTVTVIDEESPTIEIPVPVIVEAPEGTCEAFVEVPQLDVFDRCGVAQISNSFNGTSDASGIYPKGETLILWSVSDASGNTSTITGVVSVLVAGPDCNNNGIPDVCDINDGTSVDCNLDGIPDDCQADCDNDGILDVCEIEQGLSLDCNGDAVPDSCQIESGIEADCDNDGLIDSCEIITGSGIDCDSSGVLDSCEILAGTAADCNGNGQPDACDIAIGVESDCNLDGIADACQIASGSETDCNANGVIDSCELVSGTSSDCNANGTLDECDLATGTANDCNENDIPDSCDISSGVAFDCNSNGQLDSCDIVQGLVEDCDTNNVPDSCDVSTGSVPDCNSNGIPDSCDLSSGASEDCDSSGIPDSCEVASGAVTDCNVNGVPDTCDLAAGAADCNSDEVLDSCQVVSGEVPDCNSNGIPDGCDIASGTANDCDDNGVLDSCEVGNGQAADCNQNGIPDSCDITSGLESDCNESGVPDSCEVLAGTTLDCNDNGIPDSCDIASGDWQDCDEDGNLDSCEILVGTEEDCNGTGVPDSCEVLSGVAQDCNGNMVPDSCDLNNGTLFDCDLNGTPDSCDVAAGGVDDCNGNTIPDSCDLESGALSDCNQNDIPDFCEITNGSTEDCNTNMIPDSCEITAGTLEDVDLDGVPDSCQLNFLRGDGNGDGIVNIADGIFLLQSLFADGGNSNCMDAADANDDGSVDVSDVISILGYQFNGTNPPPAPYPNCGVDPAGGTSIGCISYTSCP